MKKTFFYGPLLGSIRMILKFVQLFFRSYKSRGKSNNSPWLKAKYAKCILKQLCQCYVIFVIFLQTVNGKFCQVGSELFFTVGSGSDFFLSMVGSGSKPTRIRNPAYTLYNVYASVSLHNNNVSLWRIDSEWSWSTTWRASLPTPPSSFPPTSSCWNGCHR